MYVFSNNGVIFKSDLLSQLAAEHVLKFLFDSCESFKCKVHRSSHPEVFCKKRGFKRFRKIKGFLKTPQN